MKNILLVTLTVWFGSGLAAASPEKVVDAPMSEVIVYARGAEIKRSAKVSLTKGLNTIVVSDLSTFIDQNTVQAGGKGNFTLLSLTTRTNYLNQKPKPKAMVVLEDSLKFYNRQFKQLSARHQVLTEEKDMIHANKVMKGEESTLTAAQLEAMAVFYRKRLEALYLEQIKLDEEKSEVARNQTRIRKQLQQWEQGRSKSVGEIVLEVLADAPTSVTLNLQYLVNNAYWTPSYDIRSTSASSKVDLKYYAYITQGTGVDWDEVKVKLSTSLPRHNNVKPELHPWVLRFIEVYRMDVQSNRRTTYAAPEMEELKMDDASAGAVLAQAKTASDFTRVIEGQLNLMYSIDLPYVIPSDNKPHMVHIQDMEMPASFRHFAAPKMDREAFLVAQVTGWDEYNLLPAEARVFFDNMYIGRSYVNTKVTNDTLDISMGRDRSINLERKRVRDFREKKMIGSNVRETIGIEVKVRNTKSTSVNIRIEDQIPISSNNDITVELEEDGGARLKKESGLLQWDLELKPGESRTLRFVYSVKYPKDKTINL